ncbi:phage holin family protein [Ornithinicoccus halotolerans]|uniref:phage holin family protein n=1 Tax=Ornithinicoccus halotolerans TaxID=1748220 RepID=UPI0012953928|nr:phage holin family protein [Ornithinicoccus halotolerans]
MSFLIKVLVNGVALWVAAWLVDGITLADDTSSTAAAVITVGAVALIFGVLNAVIRPALMILSVPLLVLTLGLFTFIVNAAMLALTSWLSGLLGLDFQVAEFFWDAVLGALIVTVVSLLLNAVLPDGK